MLQGVQTLSMLRFPASVEREGRGEESEGPGERGKDMLRGVGSFKGRVSATGPFSNLRVA
jgi:hypothetical protein